MEFLNKFIKTKALGYFLIVGSALLALIMGIVFFATSKGTMPNSAAGAVPETIGIYLLAGAAIELVVVVLPQYRFVHLGAVAMWCLSLVKEVFIFAPLMAGKINNVEYEGGNFGYHVVYLVIIFILLGVGIAASFLGTYKKEEELAEDMKIKPNNITKIAVTAACALVVVGSVLSSTLIEANLKKKAAGSAVVEEDEEDPNITDEIKAAAEAVEYDFKPEEVVIQEQDSYDYNDSEVKNITTGGNRSGHYLVYYFEGVYTEGYQGDYSPTYGNIYLWDDGLFGGKIRDANVRGYWFNSSKEAGTDEEGNPLKDGVVMVSNVSKYESMICTAKGEDEFYSQQCYAYLDMGWGQRSLTLYGYYYYPEVAIFINSPFEKDEFTVGENLNKGDYSAQRVLKNLKYAPVFKNSEVSWTWPSGMLNSDNKFIAAGEYTVSAKWNGFTAERTITVKEAE